jgi:sterol desaturase/sphingolipid hydroxylase (fatty acid hydroxylase superfamily)
VFLSGVAVTVGLAMFALVVCIAIEQLAAIERYSLKDRVAGILMNVVGTTLAIFLMWPLGKAWEALGIDEVITVPLWDWLEPHGNLGFALQVLALIMAVDFLAYWRHRAEHSKWLWPVHKVHHSPTELHAANSIGHPFQAIINWAFIGVPMSLFQIEGPTTPIVVGLFVSLLAIYIHSPIDVHFGPMRKVVVDNRYHRIHHSLEPRHFDKNFGICFSLWDRLFGTAYFPEPDEWPAVGVAGVAPPRSVGQFLAMPFKADGPSVTPVASIGQAGPAPSAGQA